MQLTSSSRNLFTKGFPVNLMIASLCCETLVASLALTPGIQPLRYGETEWVCLPLTWDCPRVHVSLAIALDIVLLVIVPLIVWCITASRLLKQPLSKIRHRYRSCYCSISWQSNLDNVGSDTPWIRLSKEPTLLQAALLEKVITVKLIGHEQDKACFDTN